MIYIVLATVIIAIFVMKRKETRIRFHFKVSPVLVTIVALVCVLLGVIICFTNPYYDDNNDAQIQNVTMKKTENIDLEILSVDANQIEIRVTNNDCKVFRFTDYFWCMENSKGKWRGLNFSYHAEFSKCVYELGCGESTNRCIIWKEFYGHKLKEGKYRLVWIDQMDFEIE